MKNVPSLFTSFTPHLCPAWLCPSCYNQTLRIRAGSFHFGTSAATKKKSVVLILITMTSRMFFRGCLNVQGLVVLKR